MKGGLNKIMRNITASKGHNSFEKVNIFILLINKIFI